MAHFNIISSVMRLTSLDISTGSFSCSCHLFSSTSPHLVNTCVYLEIFLGC